MVEAAKTLWKHAACARTASANPVASGRRKDAILPEQGERRLHQLVRHRGAGVRESLLAPVTRIPAWRTGHGWSTYMAPGKEAIIFWDQ